MAKTKSPIMQALFGSALACALVIVGVWAAKEYWSVDIPAHVASAMTTIATVIGTVIEHLVGSLNNGTLALAPSRALVCALLGTI